MRSFFNIFPKLLLMASICLFSTGLFCDGFYWGARPYSAFPGWQLLLFGWSAVPNGGIAWLANPALMAGWICLALRRPGLAAGLASSALALMLSFLLVNQVTSMFGETSSWVAGYGMGFWLWVASGGTLLLASFLSAMPTEFLEQASNDAPNP